MSAELMKSKFVVCKSVATIISEVIAWISFSCAYPWAICPDVFSSTWLSSELMPWRGRLSSSSVRKTCFLKRLNANFCGKVAVHHISRSFFSFFKILDLWILTNFFSFSLTWDPMAVKISKRYSYSYDSFSTKLFLPFPCDSPHKTCL